MTDSINVSLGFSLSLAGQRVRTGFDLYILFPSKFSWKKSIFRSIFEDLWAPLIHIEKEIYSHGLFMQVILKKQ